MAAVVCSRSSRGPPAAARSSPPSRTPNPCPDRRPDPGAQDTAAPGRRAAARWPRPDGPARAAPQPGGVGRDPSLRFQVRVPGSRGPGGAAQSHLPGGAAAHGLRGEQPARWPRSPRCLGRPGLGARAPRPHPSPPLKTRGAPGPRTCPAPRPPKLAPERGLGPRIHPGRGEAPSVLRAQGTP